MPNGFHEHSGKAKAWGAIVGVILVAVAVSQATGHQSRRAGQVLDGGRRFVMAPIGRPGDQASCTIQLQGHDALVYFVSSRFNVSTACQAAEELQANVGDLWQNAPGMVGVGAQTDIPSALVQGDTTICHLTGAGGAVSLWVFDSGEAVYGQQMCEDYLAAGWRET